MSANPLSKYRQASEPVGLRVLRLREKAGLTRTQLAARIGISDGGLRHLEMNPTAAPSFEVGLRLAQELNTSPWYLLTGEGAAVQDGESPSAIVLPELTVAQLVALIGQVHELAAEMTRGSVALAEAADSCAQSPHPIALPNGNKHSRKRVS